MTDRVRLTKRVVEELSLERDGAPGASQHWVTDSEFPQLVLRLTATSKTYTARWTSSVDNKRKQVSIARVGTISVDEARDRARKLVATDAAPKSVDTLDAVFKVWEELFASRVSAAHFEEFKRGWTLHIQPELGRTKLDQLTPEVIQKFYNKSRKSHAAATSNRLLAYISKLCTVAQSNRWLIGNPCTAVNKDTARIRVATFGREELRTLSNNLTAIEDKYPIGVAIVRFLALHPCRGVEARGMRWAELDFKRGLWTIPAHRYKTDRDKVFPLPAPCVTLLDSLPRWSDTYVFPSPGKLDQPMRKEYLRDTWSRCRPSSHGVHTLRKTIATGLLNGSVPLEVVSKLLGHSSTAVTQQVYAHLDPLIGSKALAAYTAMLEEDETDDDPELTIILQCAASLREAAEEAAQEEAELAAHPEWKPTTPKKAPAGLG